MELRIKKQEILELVFKLMYFAFALFSFNSFTARQAYISYISYAVAIVGAVVLLMRVIHLKRYLNINVYLLMALVVAYGISSIKVMQYGLMENIQAMVWMALQYFAVFAFDITRPIESLKKESDTLIGFFLGYTFLASVIGLIMMVVGFGYYKIVDVKYIIGGGFIWNRLYGCYMDPNYGAVFAILSIVLSVYFIKRFTKDKKEPLRIALIVNIVCEYLFICYTDSRTGLVALFAATVVFSFFCLNKANKKTFVAIILALLLGAAITACAVGIKTGTSSIRMKIAYSSLEKQGFSGEEILAQIDAERVGRTEDEINQGDVSNNRFAIWNGAFDLFKANPIIGISFRNIYEYAVAEAPDNFIKTSGFESMHNSFMDILVSQGIVGILIVLALIVSVFRTLIKNFKSIREEDFMMFLCFFTCIAAIFAEMMFYSESFYMNTGSAFLFWYFLGYLFNYLLSDKRREV